MRRQKPAMDQIVRRHLTRSMAAALRCTLQVADASETRRTSALHVIATSACESRPNHTHLLYAALQEGALQLLGVVLCDGPLDARRPPDTHRLGLLALLHQSRGSWPRKVKLYLVRHFARHARHPIRDLYSDLIAIPVLQALGLLLSAVTMRSPPPLRVCLPYMSAVASTLLATTISRPAPACLAASIAAVVAVSVTIGSMVAAAVAAAACVAATATTPAVYSLVVVATSAVMRNVVPAITAARWHGMVHFMRR
mmetsp:Transcript_61642/g.191517  ORF Transcript_61642/g.191517 Transcript_61642/m.191517 type:complete len:254 (+) Transcript_61642:46-807(+)